MTLRRRLALTTLVASATFSALLVAWQAEVRRRSEVRALRDCATSFMQTIGRAICEASPSTFPSEPTVLPSGAGPFPADLTAAVAALFGSAPSGGAGDDAARSATVAAKIAVYPDGAGLPDPDMALWAYGSDFRSANPHAPAFPVGLRAALERGDESADERATISGHDGLRVAARMPWTAGPAAVLLVESPRPPAGDEEGVLAYGLAILCALLIGTVCWAAGPVVVRIRRLKASVSAAALAGYAAPVAASGDDEIADLARAFDEAGARVRSHVAQVERREETLRRFVADTTHDVMIPLTVLQGHWAEVRDLAARGKAPAPEVVRAGLEEAHYVGALLHNLAAAAKLDAEPDGAPAPVDLGRLVERVVERHRPLARGRGVVVAGDVTLLEQAVGNVVHNAVRHNVAGGHASVALETTPHGFRLRVLDDGPGVAAAELPRLSERRFRSDVARTRDPSGRGLGLHIARRVADRHGLALTFANLVPHGLEVTLEGGKSDPDAEAEAEA